MEHLIAHFVLAALIYLLISGGAVKPAFSVKAVLVALVFTIATGALLELVQFFAPSRSPESLDLLFDGLGAVLGISFILALDSLRLGRVHTLRLSTGTAMAGILLLGVWTSISGSNATPRFADCAELLQFPFSINPLTKVNTSEARERVEDGMIALYDFSEGSGTVVHDTSNVKPALDLEINDPRKVKWISGSNGIEFTDVGSAIRSTTAASKLYDLITVSNQLSIEAWITPDNLLQDGPVRIVTMSEGVRGDEVNFHMGQSSTRSTFRLRTSCRSINEAITPETLTDSAEPSHWVMTFDGTSPKVFTNGEVQLLPELPADHFKGEFSHWDAGYPLIIGNEATLDRSYVGKIHRIAIYDRALSAGEVRRNFEMGPGDTG